LAEEIIVSKMRSRLTVILEPTQFAYRSNIGTADALIQFLDDHTRELDKAPVKYVQNAFLDFSKAFDRLQPAILIEKMIRYGFNRDIVKLLASFLSNRKHCVKYSDAFSDYVSIEVGSPQGTIVGPILWLIYVNDLQAENFQVIKYADDTTFYTYVNTNTIADSITPAITDTQTWANTNSMTLNMDKTVILNVSLTNRHQHDERITIDDDLSLTPAKATKFLGVMVDSRLTFDDHVQYVISKCNSRLYLMRQLKSAGMNRDGLKMYYCTNIRSIITYASEAWYPILSSQNKTRLERIQKTAMKIISPDSSYDQCLTTLNLSSIESFIFDLGYSHFIKILHDPDHPLFSRLTFNTNRRSARQNSVFRLPICRTAKRANSFFIFYMNYYNQQ
jgi:hypothetical protein